MEQTNKSLQVTGTADAVLGLLGGFVKEAGGLVIFCSNAISWGLRRPYRFADMIQQMEFIGNKSVFIIVLTGIFTGMALSYQVYIGFNLVNMTNLVGPVVGLGISRELGPVLTGLIVAARAGGAMAARIGTMRVTEQIDALEVMSVNPLQYLVFPRIVAAIISTPILTAIFDFVAMVGSHFLCVKILGLDEAIFWDKTSLWLEPKHINEGLFKASVFGLVFAVVCTFRGYFTKGGAKGVGDATNQGVVSSMVLIIVLDYFLTNLINVYYKMF